MILIDVSTSHMFRHLNPVGILRVEQEVIRSFREDVAPKIAALNGAGPEEPEEIVFGIYQPLSDTYYRLTDADLALLIRDSAWKRSIRPRAVAEPRLWPSRRRKLGYLRRLWTTLAAERRNGTRGSGVAVAGHFRTQLRLAEDLTKLSVDEYQAVRRWLVRAGRLRPGILAQLPRLDEIDGQIEAGNFDREAAARFDDSLRIDPARVTHYVSAGGFWSDSRHQYAKRARDAHGWCVHYLIYDMIPILWRHVTEPTTKETFPAALHWVLWGVDQIWTISQTTKNDLLAYIDENGYPPLPDDRVTPIFLGSDIDEAPGTDRAADDAVTLAKYRLEPERFVLMVGTLEPRKNHDFAYRLWRELHRRHPGEVIPLVWVGQPGWSIGPLMGQVGDDVGLPYGAIQILTVVSDAELAALYRACRFTIFPAHYEGWGLPLVESLNHGRPCIASDAPALIEAGRGAAEHIGLFEGERWLERTHALMTDDAAHAAALAHAATFERWRWRDFRADLAASFARLAGLEGTAGTSGAASGTGFPEKAGSPEKTGAGVSESQSPGGPS